MNKLKQISRFEGNFDFLRAANNNDSYQLSPAYYLFTGRKGLWFYERAGQIALICKHPNLENEFLIFYPNGYCEILAEEILKNVPIPGSVKAARISASANHASAQRAEQEHFLDWHYPVCILDTAKVGNLRGRLLADAKNNYNRAARVVDYTEPYCTKKHKNLVKQSIQKWHQKESHDGYYALLDIIEDVPKNCGLVAIKNEAIISFIHWEMPYRPFSPANSLALIADKTVKGLSEYTMIEMCRLLDRSGCQFVNIGGSETQSLHLFKMKFDPILIELNNYKLSA